MFTKSIILLLLSGGVFLCVANEVLAGPPFDLDYELHVGVDAKRYEIWVDPPDGEPYMHSSYGTHYDASYRLFKLVDWGVIPFNANAWVEQATYTKWTYWGTYEEFASAVEIADAFEFAGLETRIVPVFGGAFPSLKPWGFPDVTLDGGDHSSLPDDENKRFEELLENDAADGKLP